MTPSPSQTASSPISPRQAPSIPEAGQEHRPRATVVPFPASAPRRFRRADEGERGAILLFTGVRYERQPEAGAAPAQRRWS